MLLLLLLFEESVVVDIKFCWPTCWTKIIWILSLLTHFECLPLQKYAELLSRLLWERMKKGSTPCLTVLKFQRVSTRSRDNDDLLDRSTLPLLYQKKILFLSIVRLWWFKSIQKKIINLKHHLLPYRASEYYPWALIMVWAAVKLKYRSTLGRWSCCYRSRQRWYR